MFKDKKHMTEQERMMKQYVPGMYVLCTSMVIGDSLRGIVEAVDEKCQKVYVAWNGGPVKQHGPDEIMPAETPVFQAPKSESQEVKKVVEDVDVSTTPNLRRSHRNIANRIARRHIRRSGL